MCEISIVYALDGLVGQDGAEEVARMMAAGAATNSHGWGMFSDDNHVAKKPEKFNMAAEKAAILRDYGDKCFVVGHVRYATHGKHTDENTHPLVYKNWTLVHNGVIQNQSELRQKYGIPRAPEVDSFVILWLVNKHYMDNGQDIEKAVKQATAELKGWYSCFLYDRDAKRLFYFRNGADFHFRLVVTDNDNHFIVGNTKKDNASVAFSKSAWGFRIGVAKSLGWIHPREDALFEIADSGVSILCDLPEPVSEPVEAVQADLGEMRWKSAAREDWAQQMDSVAGKYGPCGSGKDENST